MAKSTLTKDTIARLAKFTRMGLPTAQVLDASQVARSTYYHWMSIGEALYEGDLEHPDIPKPPKRKQRESDRKYNKRLRRHDEVLNRHVTLYETMQQAPALSHTDAAKAMFSAAITKRDWRAAAEFLERRAPNDWNLKRIRRNLADKEEHQTEHSIVDPDLRDLARLYRQLAQENNANAGARNGPDSLS